MHGVDASGKIGLRWRFSRNEMIAFFVKLPPCLTGMEACSSAHHWTRELVRLGRTVWLIPPQYVKRNKTDAADAEAICEAVARPNMRFVPIKTVEQQGILALHRVRSVLVRQITAAVNAARGVLAEFGVVAGKGIQRVDELRRRMDDLDVELFSDEARTAVLGLPVMWQGRGDQNAARWARPGAEPRVCHLAAAWCFASSPRAYAFMVEGRDENVG